VHHAPPAGSPLAWDGRRAWGDEVLTGWIARFAPDLVLSGHVHQAPFVRDGGWADRVDTTWVFNPGQQAGPVPARVEVDLDGVDLGSGAGSGAGPRRCPRGSDVGAAPAVEAVAAAGHRLLRRLLRRQTLGRVA
jgi:hypothetical protein